MALQPRAARRVVRGRALSAQRSPTAQAEALRGIPSVPESAISAELARRAGASTSVDPNWDPSGRWDGGLLGLLPHIDVLLPNAAEACRLARRDDPSAAAQTLAAEGPLVAVKLGAIGALAAHAERAPVSAVAPDGVPMVDTVGAGDTFDAGLLAGLAAGESVEAALALTCACGTLSARDAGGTDGQPTHADARSWRAGPASRRA